MTEGEEEVGTCPWCGETGVGLADAEAPSDYCGHDPAVLRPRWRTDPFVKYRPSEGS